jgi:hypothetical protein
MEAEISLVMANQALVGISLDTYRWKVLTADPSRRLPQENLCTIHSLAQEVWHM